MEDHSYGGVLNPLSPSWFIAYLASPLKVYDLLFPNFTLKSWIKYLTNKQHGSPAETSTMSKTFRKADIPLEYFNQLELG